MARFYLMAAHTFGQVRYRAGTVIADSGALAGDKLVPTLTASSVTPYMRPLDAAATALMNTGFYAAGKVGTSSPYRPANVPATIPGNESIDG